MTNHVVEQIGSEEIGFSLLSQISDTGFRILHPQVMYDTPALVNFNKDIKQWLVEENITDVQWTVQKANQNSIFNVLTFNRKDDALRFKLKWM